MRISLIHGENSPLAYKKYSELVDGAKNKGFEMISIDDLHDIVNQSLFEDRTFFTIENAKKIKLSDWKWLKENANKYNSNLLIYYEGNTPITILKNLTKDTKTEKFELPKIIFTFLDSFVPHNARNALKLLDDLSKNDSLELVFALLARHLRDLYWILVDKNSLQLPDWRKRKLESQASKFTINNLELIIKKLAEIDIKVKTSEGDLKTMLDLLIVCELK